MATFIIVTVLVLFLVAIWTGGYDNNFLQRVRGSQAWDWITTVDHKKIGIMYLAAGTVFLVIGGIEALLMRMQLIIPNNDFLSGDLFNQLLTMHGTTMIFLAAMPLLFGLMNYIVPLQIGARDVSFPFLNALGFWLFLAGGTLLNLSWFFGGAPDAGWTNYAPIALNDYSTGPGIDFYVLGLQISGIGTTMGGINLIATIINMRAPGMSFFRMPMFTWTTFIASALILFAFPALTIGLALMMFDRLFGTAFFDATRGGDSVIWEHLFWIFGHPEVYIVILPAFGIMSDIISTFSRKRLFGYSSMVFATSLIGFLGFMVWVHHMFTVGLGPMTNSIFAVATMAIAVPTGIKVFNWLFTLWGGQIRFTAAMVWALGFIPTFVLGGVTGVMLAVVPADFQFHDTYFVVAHFHYVLIGGTVFGLFAGGYYWWPRMFGKKLSEKLGLWHFWLFFAGFHMTFFPQHFLGVFGMPRRVFTYQANEGMDAINFVSTIGAFAMALGTIIFVYNIYRTTRFAEKAPADAWDDGRTLEWVIPNPTPEYNFAQLPRVRSNDPLWAEKMAGNKTVEAAEPLGPIHMPSASYVPALMSLGFFIAGFGFILRANEIGALGLVVVVIAMFMRSFDQDHGYHIEQEEVERVEKEARA
ncbi:cytochrome c oxidase subunit I [Mechercharimyces sp. CAU 1602]|uniref:cytochrome c oxidase subunit I n=1 Tax=Mechercharimyces sp. CAU 1602 TaxID=2973933 RepID=UPI0021628B12|nr:cytochrome c oxidase subunit I [Mechercharimyces sp. CAU 1602]MCS1352756.1 cytochrome c oxidase subunit I [Mechercharimyces sp. CAU 1602]